MTQLVREHPVAMRMTSLAGLIRLCCFALVFLADLASASASGASFGRMHPQNQSDIERIADLYGQTYDFVIQRNGSNVGRHRLTFRREDGALSVDAESHIRIDLGPIALYRFSYHSTETWSNGRLQSVSGKTNDDGTKINVTAESHNEGLRIDGPKGRTELGLSGLGFGVFASNHWNPAVLGAGRVINTLTGEFSRVEISNEGRDVLDLGHARVNANRWTYRGDFEATSWYDNNGRWLALAFRGRDGSQIRYLCTSCRILTEM